MQNPQPPDYAALFERELERTARVHIPEEVRVPMRHPANVEVVFARFRGALYTNGPVNANTEIILEEIKLYLLYNYEYLATMLMGYIREPDPVRRNDMYNRIVVNVAEFRAARVGPAPPEPRVDPTSRLGQAMAMDPSIRPSPPLGTRRF